VLREPADGPEPSPKEIEEELNRRTVLGVSSGRTARVLLSIAEERERQDAKFPGQHLPDGTPDAADRMGLEKALDQARRARDMWRRVCQAKTARGDVTWWDVLREEFWEVGAESDPQRLREELVQLAAVAVRWAEDIDRGEQRGHHVPPEPEQDSRERKAATGRVTADHAFVPHADPGRPGQYRCGYAVSMTDASSFCWLGREAHGGSYPPSPAQKAEAERLAIYAADAAREDH
jgi:hypothetical protein